MLRTRNTLTLNRQRAYLDDPMWLLNQACRKLTGCDLPAGFTTDDWKYKLEDGIKKGVRDPLPLMKNPFATTNYYGLDTKIMRINLLNELKLVQGKQILFREIHYKLPFYKGFALFLTDEDINPTMSYSQRGANTGANPAWLDWFYSWEKELFEYCYEDETSPLYFPLSKQIINTIAQFFREYLHTAFDLGFDGDPFHNRWDDWWVGAFRQCPDFVPRFLTHDHPLKSVARRWRKDNGDIDYDTLILTTQLKGYSEYELKPCMPIFIAANFNPNIKHSFKKVLKLVKDGKESVDISEAEKRASSLVRDIIDKKDSRAPITTGSYTISWRLRNRPNKFIEYSQSNNYCQNCSVKVAKFNWIESFWTAGTIEYLKSDRNDRNHDGTIGSWFKNKTDSRKNAWEYVKKHSGLLGENEDYYAHKKYKEHHAGNITQEIMSVMF